MRNKVFVVFFICVLFFSKDLYAENKLRVISLAPAITEILFALGLNDEIVGVSQFCNYPPEAKTKQKVGSFSQPDIETILTLKPDIVFCASLEQAPVITKLRQLKLNVCVSDPKTINDFFMSVHEIARIVGRQRQAAAMLSGINSDINEVKTMLSKKYIYDKPRILLQIWDDPIVAAGEGSFVDDLIQVAGGENIVFGAGKPYSYFSSEEIIARNPDIIIFTYMNGSESVKDFLKRPSCKSLKAVKDNKVFNDINPDIILRAGPRTGEGLKEIYKRLYQ